MEWNNPFELIDLAAVEERLNVKRSTIFQRVSDGTFPSPLGGTRRACWPQLQITDYLYQVTRYGTWSQERADNALDSAYSSYFSSDHHRFSKSVEENLDSMANRGVSDGDD